jgi:3-oxoacyl-[acyl-carrier-protein] synthase III
METQRGFGILGIGTHLPGQVRENGWWPEDIVRAWGEKHVWSSEERRDEDASALTAGAKRTLAAIAEHSGDVFQGARARHVLRDGATASEMELHAATMAIERAGVEKKDIDFLIASSLAPDYLGTPSACRVHHLLGLGEGCVAFNLDAACNGFQKQLMVAQALLSRRRGRCALLVQSSAVWRVMAARHAHSVHFGDGASAVVIGDVGEGRGLLSQAHRTDGSLHRAIVDTVPERNWWEDGRIETTILDRDAARRNFMCMADWGLVVVGEALRGCGLAPADVDFFACHQATPWFRRVAQEHIGLVNARTIDTYPSTGTLSSANLPFVLAAGEREGLLCDGDVVALYQGGNGMTCSGSILRWGR